METSSVMALYNSSCC